MNRPYLRAVLALSFVFLLDCVEVYPIPAPTRLSPPPLKDVPPAPSSARLSPDPAGQAGATPRRPVTDTYHGTQVVDDYRWLEKGDDPEVKAWITAQNQRTRSYIDALPERELIQKRVSELLTSTSADRFGLIYRGGQLFALKSQPPKQQPFLVVMKSAEDAASERVLVDPNAIDPKGRTTIDFYVPSPDGKRVAVSLSEGGTEDGTVHVYDVGTGKETGDVIARVNGGTAGGSLAWTGDGKGFYYTRYPSPGERPPEDLAFFQQVYFHKLGAPVKDDKYSIGQEFPRIALVELETSDNGKYIVAKVANGDGGEYAHYLLGPSGKWSVLADLSDNVKHAAVGADGKLYLLSFKGAPRGKILRLAPDKPDLATAEVVVPESDVTLRSFEVTPSRLYVIDLVGGPSQIRVFDSKGKSLANVPILPVSSVKQMVHLRGDDILFRNASFLSPPGWYHYQASTGKSSPTALMQTSVARFDDMEVVRETCASKDGTKVPISIIRAKGIKLSGTHPTLLRGYGGFAISVSPGMDPVSRLWFDQGGVLAVANLRGGGEFGEQWHLDGNLTKKQNVFDDFAACAKLLISAGYTKPEKLAIMGGSNGGLLMGAALTQHPEMFKAVVSSVGIYDMLRVELSPNGVFNVTEYGTVKNPDHFKAMFAYSPYHRVKDKTAYPAVLLPTGANDPRVNPYHSRKMAARLQAATSSKAPILLRASENVGHGGSPLSEKIEEVTDVYAFLFHELGITFKPAVPSP